MYPHTHTHTHMHPAIVLHLCIVHMLTHKGLNNKASCPRRVLHAHNYVTSDELPHESLKMLKAESKRQRQVRKK